MLKHLLHVLILGIALLSCPKAQEFQSRTAFEGRIDYEISSEGFKWTYSIWLKQDFGAPSLGWEALCKS